MAVILVLLSHLSRAKLHILPFLDLKGVGHYGVYLFFVLSAFLLTLPMLKEETDLFSGRLWLNYAIRRFFRIYPLFIVAILAKHYVIITHLGVEIPTDALIKEIFGHLTLQIGRGVFWTIAVEFKFYTILPFIAFLFVRVFKRNLLLSALTVAAAAALTLVAYPPGVAFERTDLTPFLPIFLPGTLAALAYSKLSNVVRRDEYSGAILEAVSVGVLLVLLFTIPSPSLPSLHDATTPPGFFHAAFLPCGVLWSVFIVSSLGGHGTLRKALSSRLLRFLGLISFGVYVWHMVAINLVDRYVDAANPVKILLIISITIAVSFATFIVIKRPFMKIRLRPGK